MLSGTELFLFFNLLIWYQGSYLQKQSFHQFFLRDNLRIFFVVFGIFFASWGPILEKKVLKPSDISAAPERTTALFKTVSVDFKGYGILAVLDKY